MTDNRTELADKLVKQRDQETKDRGNFENIWQQISEFVLPNRGDFQFKRAKGTRMDARVFDTTAIQANEMLAAALHGGLTNQSTRWFDLRTGNPETQNSEAARRWLDEVVRIMLRSFDSDAGNFYQQNHEFLLDLVAYGTSCMYVEEVIGEGIQFNTRHLSELTIKENNTGVVDKVSRSFCFTARQAEQEWGEEALPAQVKMALANEPEKKFDFLHVVMPRKDAQRLDPTTLEGIPESKKFIGMYVCEDPKAVVSVSGFYEMPYLVVRWEKLIGETYGRSPAWNALSDIRMINVMSETLIRAAQKQVDPPLLVADDGVIMPMRTHPSGVNVGGVSEDGRPLVQPLQTGGNLNVGLEMMEQRRDAIRQAYFVDQFIPKQGTPVTATEAVQNQENRLRLTGPQLSRIASEYLSKLIDRVFSINQRAGNFPEAPAELENADLDVEYVSPLARTQRAQELVALSRAVESSFSVIEADPTIMDNLDGDSFFREALDISGVSIKHIKSKDDVDAIRQQRQEQQQQMQQQEQLVQGAESVAKLKAAGVDLEGG